MQLSNLTPFQRKLIAVILLRALSEDPVSAAVQRSNPEVQALLAQGFAEPDPFGSASSNEGMQWITLTRETLNALLALFYPNVEDLRIVARQADQLFQEGNYAALAQIDIR